MQILQIRCALYQLTSRVYRTAINVIENTASQMSIPVTEKKPGFSSKLISGISKLQTLDKSN